MAQAESAGERLSALVARVEALATKRREAEAEIARLEASLAQAQAAHRREQGLREEAAEALDAAISELRGMAREGADARG